MNNIILLKSYLKLQSKLCYFHSRWNRAMIVPMPRDLRWNQRTMIVGTYAWTAIIDYRSYSFLSTDSSNIWTAIIDYSCIPVLLFLST